MTEIIEPIKHLPPDHTYRIMALDSAEHIEALTLACQLDGHQVVPVLTIAEGMKFLNTRDHIDIVISAVHLENESVFDFLKQVRTLPEHKNVRFMMICSEPSALAESLNQTVKATAEIMGVDKYLMMQDYDTERLMKELTAMLPTRLPNKETG